MNIAIPDLCSRQDTKPILLWLMKQTDMAHTLGRGVGSLSKKKKINMITTKTNTKAKKKAPKITPNILDKNMCEENLRLKE